MYLTITERYDKPGDPVHAGACPLQLMTIANGRAGQEAGTWLCSAGQIRSSGAPRLFAREIGKRVAQRSPGGHAKLGEQLVHMDGDRTRRRVQTVVPEQRSDESLGRVRGRAPSWVSELRPIRTTRNNPYDVNAAPMPFQRHERSIHTVSEARNRRAARCGAAAGRR
jgi:hypothetical protein